MNLVSDATNGVVGKDLRALLGVAIAGAMTPPGSPTAPHGHGLVDGEARQGRSSSPRLEGARMQVVDLAAEPGWITDDIYRSNSTRHLCRFSFRFPSERIVSVMKALTKFEAAVCLEMGSVVAVQIEPRLVPAAVATCLEGGGAYVRQVCHAAMS